MKVRVILTGPEGSWTKRDCLALVADCGCFNRFLFRMLRSQTLFFLPTGVWLSPRAKVLTPVRNCTSGPRFPPFGTHLVLHKLFCRGDFFGGPPFCRTHTAGFKPGVPPKRAVHTPLRKKGFSPPRFPTRVENVSLLGSRNRPNHKGPLLGVTPTRVFSILSRYRKQPLRGAVL